MAIDIRSEANSLSVDPSGLTYWRIAQVTVLIVCLLIWFCLIFFSLNRTACFLEFIDSRRPASVPFIYRCLEEYLSARVDLSAAPLHENFQKEKTNPNPDWDFESNGPVHPTANCSFKTCLFQ